MPNDNLVPPPIPPLLRRTISGVGQFSTTVEKLLLHQRYQWLSDRALATTANVVDDHDASQRATDRGVSGSGR